VTERWQFKSIVSGFRLPTVICSWCELVYHRPAVRFRCLVVWGLEQECAWWCFSIYGARAETLLVFPIGIMASWLISLLEWLCSLSRVLLAQRVRVKRPVYHGKIDGWQEDKDKCWKISGLPYEGFYLQNGAAQGERWKEAFSKS